ncbi:hypothetical protein HDU78_009159 [Chytriomyces hyalinus]|nr:hypothetical protein HDU78_009159 [Chytriomyces hyalinus]
MSKIGEAGIRRASSANSAAAVSSTNTIASTSPASSQPLPEWNSTKILHPKPASKSVKRSKSYAASLRKNKSGNVIESGDMGEDEETDFVNGQSKTTRALQSRVAELEAQLDTATKDTQVLAQQLETAGSEHRYSVDKLKQDCQEQLHDKDLSYAQETQQLRMQVSLLTAEIERAHVKEATQALEISKLHAQVLEISQLATEREVEVASLGAEAEAARRKAAFLQVEVSRLQGVARTTAQASMEKEMELETKLEVGLKEAEILKGRLVAEKGEYERVKSTMQTQFDRDIVMKESRIVELLDRETALMVEVNSVNRAASALQLDNSKFKDALNSTAARIQILETSTQEKDNLIESQAATLFSQESKMEGLISESKASQCQLEELVQALESLKNEKVRQDLENKQLFVDLQASSSAQLAQSDETLSATMEDNAQMQRTLEEYAAVIANLKLQLQDSAEHLAVMRGQMKNFEEDKKLAFSALSLELTEKDSVISAFVEEREKQVKLTERHVMEILTLQRKVESATEAYERSQTAHQSSISAHEYSMLALKRQVERDMSEKDALISRLTQDIEVLARNLAEKKGGIANLTELLAESEKTLELVHAELVSAKMMNADSSQAVTSDMDTMRLEKDDLIGVLNAKITSLLQSIETHEKEATNLQMQLANAHQSSQKIQANLATITAENETQFLTMKMQLENTIAQQLQIIAELRQDIIVTSLDLEEKVAQEAALTQASEADQTRIAALQRELTAAKRSLHNEAKQPSVQKDTDVSNLQREVSDLQTRIDFLDAEIAQKDAALIQTTKSLDIASAQLKLEKHAHDVTKESLTSQIKEAVVAMQSEITELKRHTSSGEAGTLCASLAAKDEELMKLKEAMRESATLINSLKGSVSEANSNAMKLNEEKIFLKTKRLKIVEKNLEIQTSQSNKSSRKVTNDSVRNSVVRNSIESSPAIPSRLSLSGKRDSADAVGMIPRAQVLSVDLTSDDDSKQPSSMKPPQPQSRPTSSSFPFTPPPSRNSISAGPLQPLSQSSSKTVPTVEAAVASFVSDLDNAFNF